MSRLDLGSVTGVAALTLQAGTGNMLLTGAISTTITIGKSNGTGTIQLGNSSASSPNSLANASLCFCKELSFNDAPYFLANSALSSSSET